jgi:hypothetical protein
MAVYAESTAHDVQTQPTKHDDDLVHLEVVSALLSLKGEAIPHAPFLSTTNLAIANRMRKGGLVNAVC